HQRRSLAGSWPPHKRARASSAPIAERRARQQNGRRLQEETMRTQLLALSFLVAVSPAFAAQAPDQTFISKAQITALGDKAKADRKGDAPLVAEPILTLAPYRAQLEYRPGTSPAAIHEKDAELMVVLQGQGNIVTGGKLVNEKRNNANNLGGDSIMG